jgi:uncharacterized YccA/Bax inhibitor family protein
MSVASTDRSGLAARRVAVGALGGGAAALIAALAGASWSVAVLYAEDVAAIVFLVWVWLTIGRSDAVATVRVATAPPRAASTSRASSPTTWTSPTSR